MNNLGNEAQQGQSGVRGELLAPGRPQEKPGPGQPVPRKPKRRSIPKSNASKPIGRGLGISAGIDAGLARRNWPSTVNASDTTRCGRTTSPPLLAWRRLRSSPVPPPQLELGVGVLPLDRHQPVTIAAEIARLGLDPAKLWIGVGSGQLRAPLGIVRRAVAELRELLPHGTHIVVGAMRPQLCRMGGAIADGVLLNWMLPVQAALCRRWVLEGADQAGRSSPVLASYVPRRPGAQLAATAPRRGEPLPKYQPSPSPALRGLGCPARQRRCGRIDTVARARRIGTVRLRGRPSDRSAARRRERDLAASCGDCSGAVGGWKRR